MKLYETPFSTNVERVTLAAALKGVELERVAIPDDDRSAVEALSGQPLVPVIDHDGRVVADSMAIIAYLEELTPDPPLHTGRADVEVFVDWFNRVWKVAPNAIADSGETEPHAADMQRHLGWFEGLLEGRDFLLGAQLTAADIAAYPFLKYAGHRDPEDDEVFHVVLDEHQTIDGRPNLARWLERIPETCR